MSDAVEVGLMAEGGPAVPFLLVLDLSTPCAIVKHSTVENRLDVGVILLVIVLRRVQVKSVGELGYRMMRTARPPLHKISTPQIT